MGAMASLGNRGSAYDYQDNLVAKPERCCRPYSASVFPFRFARQPKAASGD